LYHHQQSLRSIHKTTKPW